MGVVKHTKYTNKDFKDNFVDLASNSTQKGHLTKQKRSGDDNQTVEGILKYIVIDRIDSNGWMVEVGSGSDSFVYPCTNSEPFLTIPDCTVTKTKYVPKKKTRVEISIDKHTKIYNIIRVIGTTSVMSNYQDKLKISIDQNTKTNKDVNAEITMTGNSIILDAHSVIINNQNTKTDLLSEQKNQANQIQILIDENIMLKEKINEIEKQLN